MRLPWLIKQWWRKARRRRRVRRVRFVESMSLVPRHLGGDLYMVGLVEMPKWALLRCPCRCGDRLDVNLSRSRRPFWKLGVDHHNRVSLNPSLWRPTGTCESHFLIRRNRFIWVEEREQAHTAEAEGDFLERKSRGGPEMS